MNRRSFIAALGGAAAWPLAARAQQGDVRVDRNYMWGATQSNVAQAPLFTGDKPSME